MTQDHKRPPLPRWKLPLPVKTGLWGRTPPALFPAVMGLAGLALAWRGGVAQFALPSALADMLAGAVALFTAFALLTLIAKIAQRPAVLDEDLRILPGRAGIPAAVLASYLLAALIWPWLPMLAGPLWALTLLAHVALIVLYIRSLITGPAEQRRVTPAWHLVFTGPIVAVMAGLPYLAVAPAPLMALAGLTLVAGIVIWGVSLAQFAQEIPPAPLRPLLTVHLAPVALFGIVAQMLGASVVAVAFGWISVVLLAVLLAGARWLLAAGFSPLWGALTFPLAATANLWLGLGWRLPGGLLLVFATVVILPVTLRVGKMWASGQLAVRTNAAAA